MARRCGSTSAAATTRSRESRIFTESKTTRSSSARSCPEPKYESQSLSLPRSRALRLRHAGGADHAVRARAAAAAGRAAVDDLGVGASHLLDRHHLRPDAPSAVDE